MSESLERSAEIVKLARLLDVPTGELDFLDELPAAVLREFRSSATDLLFERDAAQLHRVAASSRLVPIPLAAKVAQLAFGPLLCAAVSGLLEPDRAVRTAVRMPTRFLADVAAAMDPRRAAAVIAAMPATVVTDVGVDLVARGDHVTTGRFVGFLPRTSLEPALGAFDDADLLRIAFVLEDKDRLDELLELAQDRLGRLLVAAHEHDLWSEALDLVGHLNEEHLRTLGEVAAAQPDEVLTPMIEAAQRVDAWAELLPVTALMSEAALARFAALPAVHRTEVLDRIVDAALAADLWELLLPLAATLPQQAQAQLGRRATELARADVSGARDSQQEAGRTRQ